MYLAQFSYLFPQSANIGILNVSGIFMGHVVHKWIHLTRQTPEIKNNLRTGSRCLSLRHEDVSRLSPKPYLKCQMRYSYKTVK